MTIDDFLQTRYVKYGREAPELDCWGLVRLARVELFCRDELPSYVDIDPENKADLTASALAVKEQGGFEEVAMRPGAIVTAWRARLCVHVGIAVEADGRIWILETDGAIGPALSRPSMFGRRYTRVICYDN